LDGVQGRCADEITRTTTTANPHTAALSGQLPGVGPDDGSDDGAAWYALHGANGRHH
jgi:hypothetical protein